MSAKQPQLHTTSVCLVLDETPTPWYSSSQTLTLILVTVHAAVTSTTAVTTTKIH